MTVVRIRRDSKQGSVTVGTSVASSTTMSVAGAAGGVVLVSGVTASATVAVHGSTGGLTFAPLHDATGAAVTLVVPEGGGAVNLPDAVHGLKAVRLVSDASLGTAASVVVVSKT